MVVAPGLLVARELLGKRLRAYPELVEDPRDRHEREATVSCMRALFVMRHPAAVRAYSPMLHLLSARGHEVHLAFRRIKTAESHRELQRLADECPGITFGGVPARGGRGISARTLGWALLSEQLRHDIDYLRYLDPVYADAAALRERATARLAPRSAGSPGPRARRAAPPPRRSTTSSAAFRRTAAAHRALPRRAEPDVLLVTHLAELGSARPTTSGRRSGSGSTPPIPVFSWDNLTNKGLLHDAPELVLVWNEPAGERGGRAPRHPARAGAP